MIDAYSFGVLTVDGRRYDRDLILLPDGTVVHPWRRRSGHRLALADLDAVLEAAPDRLVAGTGASGLMRPAEGLAAALAERGIELLAEPTGRAVATFNARAERGEKVAGGFHLTC